MEKMSVVDFIMGVLGAASIGALIAATMMPTVAPNERNAGVAVVNEMQNPD